MVNKKGSDNVNIVFAKFSFKHPSLLPCKKCKSEFSKTVLVFNPHPPQLVLDPVVNNESGEHGTQKCDVYS